MSSAASSPAHSVASGSTGVAANENSDQFKFSTSEKVFCYHGPLIYDARCVKSKLIDGKPTYLIHYHGWSKNWDEWVDESRILVYNDESKRLYDQSNMKKKNVTPRGAGQKRKSATAEKNTADSTPTSSGGGKVVKTLSSSSTSSTNVDSPSVFIHSTHKKSESGQSRSGKSLSSASISTSSTSVSTPTTSSAVAGSISTLALKSSDYQSDDDDEDDVKEEDDAVKDNVLSDKVSTSTKDQTVHHSSQTSQVQTPAIGSVTTTASSASSATPIVKKPRKRSSKLLRNEITENRLMLAASSIGTTIKIAIPDGLKQILVDDMDYINNKSMLVYFPQPMTVNEILDEYIRERSDKFREHFEKQQEQMESTNESSDDTNQHNPLTQGPTAPFTSIQLQNDDLNLKLDNFGHRFYRSCLRDVCNGIRNYFNVLLGTQLLYKFERVQYRQQVKLLLASLSNPESSNAKQSPNNNNNSTDPNGSSDSESKSNLEPGASMDTENSSSSTSSFVIAHHQKKSIGTGKGTSRPLSSGNKTKAGSNKGSNKGQNNNLSGSQENSFFRACNNQSLSLCSVYGFTHLLRLFTVLGRMVSTFQLDQGIVDTLLAVFDDLLAYLDENRDRLFDPDRIYTNVDQEYFRVAL